MRKFVMILVLCALPYLPGCTSADSRTQRAASLLNAKTQVAKQERDAAKTPEEKLKIDDEYFKTAGEFTQILDDTVHNRKSTDPELVGKTPAPATTPAPTK